MNIAVFGGSFDPFHIGHEKIVSSALKLLDIEKLFVVPSYLNPFKKEFHFTPLDRYKLVKELYKDDQNIEVLDYELNQNRSTPTIKTINHIQKVYKPKKIYLIIGADNFYKLHLWDSFEELKRVVEFVVVSREGYEVKDGIIPFKEILLEENISSTYIRETKDISYIPKKIKQKVEKLWTKE